MCSQFKNAPGRAYIIQSQTVIKNDDALTIVFPARNTPRKGPAEFLRTVGHGGEKAHTAEMIVNCQVIGKILVA